MTRKRSKPAKKAARRSVAPVFEAKVCAVCGTSWTAPPDSCPECARKAASSPRMSSLDEAIAIRTSVKARLDSCKPEDMAKYVDAYSRAANVVRQLEKDRKRSLVEFTDDEIVEYVRELPERRRDAVVIALQGSSLAGKPLFG